MNNNNNNNNNNDDDTVSTEDGTEIQITVSECEN
jgi:hypothetical protein